MHDRHRKGAAGVDQRERLVEHGRWLTCLDCSSVISSEAFMPLSVINLPQHHAMKIGRTDMAYQLTIRLLPSQSLLPLNLA
jgi:hypothetical protein